MAIKFTKMHGLGNDFVVIDATEKKVELTPDFIQRAADRRLGIGFDQLLVIEPAQNQQDDFLYRIFNANGQEVEQCGNGARCVAHYIFTQKLFSKESLCLTTLAGSIALKKEPDGQITVNMGRAHFAPASLPFITAEQQLHYTLALGNDSITFSAVSMGNPHVVLVVKDMQQAQVERIGQQLQHHPAFPKQVNVGFMQIISPHSIYLRVYERGVGETQACGSGACAAVVIGRLCYGLAPEVLVTLPGGNLTIKCPSVDKNIFLTGPAVEVFQGQI